MSRPPWARGLKLRLAGHLSDHGESRPPWARGLKPKAIKGVDLRNESRPPWARGLKLVVLCEQPDNAGSRPPWARGLKHSGCQRCPCRLLVAPPVGAWIETQQPAGVGRCLQGRAPRGRVD